MCCRASVLTARSVQSYCDLLGGVDYGGKVRPQEVPEANVHNSPCVLSLDWLGS